MAGAGLSSALSCSFFGSSVEGLAGLAVTGEDETQLVDGGQIQRRNINQYLACQMFSNMSAGIVKNHQLTMQGQLLGFGNQNRPMGCSCRIRLGGRHF